MLLVNVSFVGHGRSFRAENVNSLFKEPIVVNSLFKFLHYFLLFLQIKFTMGSRGHNFIINYWYHTHTQLPALKLTLSEWCLLLDSDKMIVKPNYYTECLANNKFPFLLSNSRSQQHRCIKQLKDIAGQREKQQRGQCIIKRAAATTTRV